MIAGNAAISALGLQPADLPLSLCLSFSLRLPLSLFLSLFASLCVCLMRSMDKHSLYVYVHACVYVYVYIIYIYTYGHPRYSHIPHTCIHTYILTYVHASIHTYIRTYRQTDRQTDPMHRLASRGSTRSTPEPCSLKHADRSLGSRHPGFCLAHNMLASRSS